MKPENIARILSQNCGIGPEEKLVLGFSGGADSVCLLDILVRLGYKPVIAYFNHQLREGTSQEVDFAHDAGRKYSCDTVIGAEDILLAAENENRGIEETARKYRYRFLSKVAAERNIKFIVVAHHADDQAETVLMHLLRGTGLAGLGGMRYERSLDDEKGLTLIRPLLDVRKSEIFKYCSENKLTYFEDATNTDMTYFRNRIRHELIPELETYNPAIRSTLHRFAEIMRYDAGYIDLSARSLINQVVDEKRPNFAKIAAHNFRSQAISLQREIIKILLRDIFNFTQDQTFDMVELVRNTIVEKRSGDSVNINDSLKILVEKDTAFFYIDDNDLLSDDDLFLDAEKRELEIPGVTPINGTWDLHSEVINSMQIRDSVKKNDNTFVAFTDKGSLGDEVYARRWQAGDRFAPLGMDGRSMKVSDFLINKSHPLRLKTAWPLIFSNEILIWIPGYQPADSVRVSQTTEFIVRFEVKKKQA